MKIAIGADHRGFEQKQQILKHCNTQSSHILYDLGTDSEKRTDYPLFAKKVVQALIQKKVDAGILLCGTGIGMAIAANRYKHVFAGVAWNEQIARLAKEDDNVDVLVIPSDFVDNQTAIAIVEAWLHASFRGGRYAHRLEMIDH